MEKYIKLHMWDYLFTVLISIGLALNVFSSYVLTTPFVTNYAVIIVSVLAINCLMFVFGYNKRNAITGTVILVVAAVGAMLFLRAKGYLSSGGSVDRSLPIFWAIIVISTIVTYLTSRSKKLFIPFSVAAILVSAAFRFLEYPVSVPAFLIMLVGLVLELLYKVFYDSIASASYGSFNFKHFFVQSTAVTLIVFLLSGGVFYGIIKPLNPPTRELKLITRLLSLDILEQIGVASTTELPAPDAESNKVSDKNKTTNQENKDKNESIDNEKQDEKQEENKDLENETNDDLRKNSGNILEALAISYEQNEYTAYIIAAVVIFIIALPFVIKFLLRRSRRKKIESMQPHDGMVYLYTFFLNKLKKVGLTKAPNLTLMEYVETNKSEFTAFDESQNVKFPDLTNIYNSSIYGGYTPTDSDYDKFKNYYDGFFKSARNRVGNLKYAFKFWTI